MKLSIAQFCPKFADKEFNLNYIKNIAINDNSDIIVFPELCTTGYDFNDKDEMASLAEDFSGQSVSEMQDIATNHDKIICFGFAEKSGDKYFNSAAILFPDASYSDVYRKTHLFFRERFIFNENDKGFFVTNYKPKDVNVGVMICYDWRFPEAARTLALKGADVILCPSNLVTNVWHISTPSRALENKVYLAVANRIGSENRNDNELYFNGKSAVYGYNGSQIISAGETSEEIISAEIYPEKTRNKSFNEFNDIFTDRRPQFYM